VLERPFSYLGQLPDGSVQGILQEQDPAQRATIALHLPAAIRLKYLQSVDVAGKQFLFEEILKLEAVRLADLRALDQSVKARVRQEAGQEAADAPTLPLVQDFLSTLTADEEIQLLKSAKSAARLRPHYASPAFLDTWTDDSLKLAFADENPFVAAAYLGCFPEMRARIEAAMPPISLIILTDEMTTLENRPAADRQAALETLRKRVRDLVKTGQVGLIALDLTPMSETAQREAA
jgi:hypothetical protein